MDWIFKNRIRYCAPLVRGLCIIDYLSVSNNASCVIRTFLVLVVHKLYTAETPMGLT